MAGYFYFFSHFLFGILLSKRVFYEAPRILQIWIGGLFGLIGMMWVVVPIAFIGRFTVVTHFVAWVIMGVFSVLGYFFIPRSENPLTPRIIIDYRIFFIVIPFSMYFIYLFSTHYLFPGTDGLYCGGNAYGDLPFHLGIITSLKEQKMFPPHYSIFPWVQLGYPFLIDSLSSSLYLLGMSLRNSLLFPSASMAILLLMGFVIFSYEVSKKWIVAIISTLLFFVNGGLGIFYYFPNHFSKIFTEAIHSPTHLFDHNIIWSNVICDLLIPQRTTLGGWAFLLFAFWCLYRGISTSEKKYFFLSGLMAGFIPMIHTHSFLAFVVIALVWFVYFFRKTDNKTQYLIHWSAFAFPSLFLSIPQIIYWTIPQSVSGGFVRLFPGWANQGDIWPWFWIKNTGVFFILLLIALFSPNKRLRAFYLPAIVLFILAEFVVFQPWAWDNIKIFFIWYMFSVIFVADYLQWIAVKITKRSVRLTFIGVMVGICILSGTFSLVREAFSSFRLFSNRDLEIADFVRTHTSPQAIFLTSDFHNNPISALAGRNIVMGYEGWLWSHGIDYQERAEDIRALFSNTDQFFDLINKYGIDYMYISSNEKTKYGEGVYQFLKRFPIVYGSQGAVILSLSKESGSSSQSAPFHDSN